MLEEISTESLQRVKASNQPIFSTDHDYAELLKGHQELRSHWELMSGEEKKSSGGLAKLTRDRGLVDLKQPSLIPSKNFYLLSNEVERRIERRDPLKLLPIDPLVFEEETLELSESIENVNEIRELYKLRKATVGTTANSGISAEEAAKLKNCFSQGRELFISGRNGSLMVKPLNFFYALTAYTYGIIILNNPIRYRKDMLAGSHGMSYLPTTLQAQFGGDCARGTFSDLVGAFPTHGVRKSEISFHIDCSQSLLEFDRIRFDVNLGSLLSMIPEMADYYELTTGRKSRCFPLEIVNANELRTVSWEFQIGNGETRPSAATVAEAFNGFATTERHGKLVVTVPALNASKIKACIYTDFRGKLWFVENPFFPVILPEVAVHFLITSIFSNIMRYRPDEWGNVLLKEVPSNITLLTQHYFSTFQRKFLILILRSISRYIPYAL
nr:YaaC family protein [uncultured Cohaesibacter sp.]